MVFAFLAVFYAEFNMMIFSIITKTPCVTLFTQDYLVSLCKDLHSLAMLCLVSARKQMHF